VSERDLGVGDVLGGRYRIEARLGEGAAGVVFRALQQPLGREVAVKVLRPSLCVEARARARFEREARVASALDHPSAVTIHDFGEADGRVYLAMELLEGQPLRARISPPMELAEVLSMTWQVADVLVAAHKLPLVHRDLKPENVFVETGDRVRVLDFGLAFLAGDNTSGRMTVEGVVAGTPAYLSPEQARGGQVGPPTDIYALGCVLYEMLSGRVPFVGTDVEVLTKQLFAPPPPLRELRSDLVIPTALGELLGAMLRKRAEERPTALTLRDALAEIDPDLARSRERARDDSYLLSRAGRMVQPAVDGRPTDGGASPQPDIEVAIVGSVDPDLLVGLAANGMAAYVVSSDQPISGARVIFAPEASLGQVAELVRTGVPVVSDTDAADMERISALLRLGADEVIVRPVATEELARRVLRAVRKHDRGPP